VPAAIAHARPIAAALAALVLATAALPAGILAAGPNDAQLRDAEALVLRRINEERADLHLRPIRMDGRIREVAGARSRDMVARDYFAHQDPDGQLPWDHLNAARIAWYAAGEIIAANWTTPIDAAAVHAVQQWMGSSGHHAQIVSSTFNYAGVGVAVDASGQSLWTVVFIQGPDRTGPSARITSASSPWGSREARVRWSGADPWLVTLTAGIASYDVQRRRRGGSWTTIRSRVTGRGLTTQGRRAVRYEFRVRARDRAGNLGDWSAIAGVTIR
jgi:uncharacterized protein YkwD